MAWLGGGFKASWERISPLVPLWASASLGVRGRRRMAVRRVEAKRLVCRA
jgi:hypothetical protein